MICEHFMKFTQPVLGSGRLCLSLLLKAVYSSREKKYFIIRRGEGSSGGNPELWVFKNYKHQNETVEKRFMANDIPKYQ